MDFYFRRMFVFNIYLSFSPSLRCKCLCMCVIEFIVNFTKFEVLGPRRI